MRWLATEIQVLEALLLARLELEKDPNTEELDRLQTFQLLSDQMKAKGFLRTAAAIERRLAGRILFRTSPASKKAVQQDVLQPSIEKRLLDLSKGVLVNKHSRSTSSSSDDIPLSQLRAKFRDSSMHMNVCLPQPLPALQSPNCSKEVIDCDCAILIIQHPLVLNLSLDVKDSV